MNIAQIVSSTRAYNFHAHTQFCDGRDTIAAIARKAAELGYTHFGFTPHSPVPIESPCNMAQSDIPAYIEAIEDVRREFEGRMNIYRGVEIDYLGENWGPASPLFKSGIFDFAIGSVHFIKSQEGIYVDIDGRFEHFRERMDRYFHNDILYVVNAFYQASHSMLDEGGFDILGHFDKIGHNASLYSPGIEDDVSYKNLVNDFIDHVISSGFLVEINTKAFEQHGRFFPGDRYWKRLIDAGCTLVVNSDAHYADRINSGRYEAYEVLDSLAPKFNKTLSYAART